MPHGTKTAISCERETYDLLKAHKGDAETWDDYLKKLYNETTIVSDVEVATLDDVKAAVREGRGDE